MQEAGHGADEGVRAVPVDLPETVAGDAVVVAGRGLLHVGAPAQPQHFALDRVEAGHRDVLGQLGEDRAEPLGPGSRGRDQEHQRAGAVGRGGDLNAFDALQVDVPEPERVDGVHGQGHLPDREDGVGAVRVHAELSGRGHGEARRGCARRGPPPRRRPGSPTASTVMPRQEVDAGQAAQLFGQHLGLEAALALQGDVAEFGAAHGRVAVRPGAHGIGQVPEVLHPVRGSRQDFHDVAAPELGVRAGLREADPDLLAGDAVADEHHPPFVPGHAVPAVGDRPDVDGQFGVGLRLGARSSLDVLQSLGFFG